MPSPEYPHPTDDIPPEFMGPFGVPKLPWLVASAKNMILPDAGISLVWQRSEGFTEEEVARRAGQARRSFFTSQTELYGLIGAAGAAHAMRILIEAEQVVIEPESPGSPDLLNTHEKEALEFISRGYSVAQAAALMQAATGLLVTRDAVKHLLHSSYAKLEARSRPQYVRRAYETKVLERMAYPDRT